MCLGWPQLSKIPCINLLGCVRERERKRESCQEMISIHKSNNLWVEMVDDPSPPVLSAPTCYPHPSPPPLSLFSLCSCSFDTIFLLKIYIAFPVLVKNIKYKWTRSSNNECHNIFRMPSTRQTLHVCDLVHSFPLPDWGNYYYYHLYTHKQKHKPQWVTEIYIAIKRKLSLLIFKPQLLSSI